MPLKKTTAINSIYDVQAIDLLTMYDYEHEYTLFLDNIPLRKS